MPTPKRRSGGEADVVCGTIAALAKEVSGNGSREGPPPKSGVEEACDERSRRWRASGCNKLCARRRGVNLQQEVEPHQTERPPRDFVGQHSTARRRCGNEHTSRRCACTWPRPRP